MACLSASCNCVIVYDNGSPVAGSGTPTDPYVIEVTRINTINDYNGTLIVPDSAGAVTLPLYTKCLKDELGNSIAINSTTGCATITATGMTSFNILDSFNISHTIGNASIVKMTIQGDLAVNSGNPIAGEGVQWVGAGNVLVLPAMTVRAQETTTATALTLTNGAVTNLAAIDIGSPTNFRKNKTAHVVASIIQSSAALTPVLGEQLQFEIALVRLSNPTQKIIVGKGFWSPNYATGYQNYSGAGRVTGNELVDTWQLKFTCISNTLSASRTLSVNYSNILWNWV